MQAPSATGVKMNRYPWEVVRASRLVAAAGGCIVSVRSIAATASATQRAFENQWTPNAACTKTPIADDRTCPRMTFFGRAKWLWGTANRIHAEAASGAIKMGIPRSKERYEIRPKARTMPIYNRSRLKMFSLIPLIPAPPFTRYERIANT